MDELTDKPAETLLFDFLNEQIKSSASDSIIYELELHDTIHQEIKKPRGVRISDAVGSFSPGVEMEEKEFDVFIELACFARVKGTDKQSRQPALTDVFLIQKEIYRILRGNATLGGRVCDSLLRRGARGYDVYDGEPYAVANVSLIINPSGAQYDRQN